MLLQYPWIGNVRELRNFVERLILVENDNEIKADHLAFLFHQSDNGSLNLQEQDWKLPVSGLDLDLFIEQMIYQALEMSHGIRRGRQSSWGCQDLP